MKAGYEIVNTIKNDSLGIKYKVAYCLNIPSQNKILISYWEEQELIHDHPYIVAIFKIKPKKQ